MDETSKMSVREKTERARNFDRIFESLFGNIRLADESNRRHRAALEFPFHRRERDRLMIADHFRLRVAGGKGNEKRGDQTNQCSRAKIKSRLDRMKTAQRVEGADCCDD